MDLELLREFFLLDHSFITTPQVIGEISDDTQISDIEYYVQRNSLVIDSQGTLETIQGLYEHYQGLSYADCSVLELTIRINGTLLSSDKKLRNVSKNNLLEVKGVLWIIEELVNKGIISSQIAVDKLEYYHNINIRIPLNEVRLLIERLTDLNPKTY
jgi:hypothetical protein